jgi:hypothetical protein
MDAYRNHIAAPERASLDDQIAALEAQLAPEPTPAEIEEREKQERVAALKIKVRKQQIEKALAVEREAAKGAYLVDVVDFDERAELDPQFFTWCIVRGSSRAETKDFEDAQAETKLDADSGRAKLVTLAKKCIMRPRVFGDVELTSKFEDAVNKRFGMGLNSLVEKILRLGGHRAAQERAFR